MATESRQVPGSSAAPPVNTGDVHSAVDPIPRSAPQAHRVKIIVWSITVVACSIFFAFGSITVQAGSADGASRSVVSVWQGFGQNLPEVGHQTLLEIVYVGAIVVTVMGSMAGLWLAMRDGDATDLPVNGHNSSRPS